MIPTYNKCTRASVFHQALLYAKCSEAKIILQINFHACSLCLPPSLVFALLLIPSCRVIKVCDMSTFNFPLLVLGKPRGVL